MRWKWPGAVVALCAVLVAGCWGTKAPPAWPVPDPPKEETPVRPPATVGITLAAAGPGLVVEGFSPMPQVHVELRKGAQVLQKADVTPKDDGWWRVTWPVAGSEGAEVVVSELGAPDKVLVRGAVGTKLHEGLFYGGSFSATHVDVVGGNRLTIQGVGRLVRLELWSGDRLLATHPTTLAESGQFDVSVPWVPGSQWVWLYSGDQVELKLPIVTH